MEFSGFNPLAIGIATVAAFVFGSVFYGTLAKPWMRAAGITPEEAKMGPSLFAMTFACEIVMAIMVAGVIGHLGDDQITLRNGVISALFIWLGFVITTMIVNHRYGGKGWDLTLIDGAHWLGVLLIMGAIIGFMGL
ncbi:MAG: DUF1761 domain-containing protein [Pseudomonadota bacterium]